MPRSRTLALAALLAVGLAPAAARAQYYVAPQVNDWQNYNNGRQVNPYRGQVQGAPVVVVPTAPAYGYGYGNGGYGYGGVTNQPQITINVPDTRSFNDKYGFTSTPR